MTSAANARSPSRLARRQLLVAAPRSWPPAASWPRRNRYSPGLFRPGRGPTDLTDAITARGAGRRDLGQDRRRLPPASKNGAVAAPAAPQLRGRRGAHGRGRHGTRARRPGRGAHHHGPRCRTSIESRGRLGRARRRADPEHDLDRPSAPGEAPGPRRLSAKLRGRDTVRDPTERDFSHFTVSLPAPESPLRARRHAAHQVRLATYQPRSARLAQAGPPTIQPGPGRAGTERRGACPQEAPDNTEHRHLPRRPTNRPRMSLVHPAAIVIRGVRVR